MTPALTRCQLDAFLWSLVNVCPASALPAAVNKYLDELRAGKRFKAQQMGGEEMSVSTVSDMGFPVSLRLQVPWLVRAAGSAMVFSNHSAQANITIL